MNSDRNLRSSQLISPYGPGAIVDIGDESLLLTGLNDWPTSLPTIDMPRLIRELGVNLLKSPPVLPSFSKPNRQQVVKAIRFPKWMFCPKCRRMEQWRHENGHSHHEKPACSNPKCNNKYLTPMRFVMACEDGHLSDVPWDFWAHSGRTGKRECSSKKGDLYFRNDTNKGSGLDALYIDCRECGSKRDLGDIASPDAIKTLKIKCNGSQPWETWGECDKSPVALQRGASNLYYPIVRSALDVPSESGGADPTELLEQMKSHVLFAGCRELLSKNSPGYEPLLNIIADDLCSTPDEIKALILGGETKPSTKKEIPSTEELQLAEWKVLSSQRVVDQSSKNFLARIEERSSKTETWGLGNLISQVVLLDKLREVRAFCGFERVRTGVNIVSPAGQNESIRWLPAIEVFGEGFFLEFNQQALSEWEKKAGKFVSNRIAQMQSKYDEGKVNYLPEPSSKLVVIHTLAHLLIRQLSFECGYSSGSIRERIYAAEGQAGLLIYTADSDSEGSLGGLVQQGEQSRIYSTIASALDQASWCSNDPVCSEMETQGVMGLNKAACHSCTLVSETSCTMNNLMLDRKLLLGDETGQGFFTSVVNSIKNS